MSRATFERQHRAHYGPFREKKIVVLRNLGAQAFKPPLKRKFYAQRIKTNLYVRYTVDG